MADVALYIDDLANRLTLKSMLEAAGHRIVPSEGAVTITDSPARALMHAAACPALVLATASDVGEVVAAMQEGVYGYVLLPFQPGEAASMVQRALGAAVQGEEEQDLSLDEVESRHILDTLRRHKNNQAKAARILGIGRNTLWRKLKRIRAAEEAVAVPPEDGAD